MPNTAKRRGAAWPLKSNVIDPLAHLLQMGDFFIVCLFFYPRGTTLALLPSTISWRTLE